MNVAEDIAKIQEQEAALVFPYFNEATAFVLGSAIRGCGITGNMPIVVDIQTWDRPLFYAALPGSTADHTNWARRKRNVVRTFLKSTYRLVLELDLPDRTFNANSGLDVKDYVLAGGGFPITVKNAGMVGAIAVSGLPQRDDHGLIVRVLAEHLGLEVKALALPGT
jgi:uncharacterized protein (UPF0303 family)